MNYSDEPSHNMPFPLKALLLVVIGVFAVLGVIGLILPIIPGILFLALAALLLAKVSSRFAFHLDNHSAWIKLKRYWRSIGFLSLSQKLKLSLLVAARGIVDGLDTGVQFLRRKLDNRE